MELPSEGEKVALAGLKGKNNPKPVQPAS